MSAERTAIAALLGMTAPGSSSATQSCALNNGRASLKRAAEDEPPYYTPGSAASVRTLLGTHVTQSDTGGTGEQTAALTELKVAAKKRKKSKVHVVEQSFPAAPRVVQVCKMPKTHVDHTYRDFSSVPPEPGYFPPQNIDDMSFAQKLHLILSSPQYSTTIAWQSHGRAFKILIPIQLEQQKILSRFFGHNRYSTFLSQLKNYGLKQLTQGQDKNCYYHEFMLRGLPHLCKYMPAFKEGRKLLADAQNEPDLPTISMLWPVPERAAPPVVSAAIAAGRQLSVGAAGLASMLPTPRPQEPTASLLGLGSSLAVGVGGRASLPAGFGMSGARSAAVTTEDDVAAFLSNANFSRALGAVSENQVSSILAQANFARPSAQPIFARPSVVSERNINSILSQASFSRPSGGLSESSMASLLQRANYSLGSLPSSSSLYMGTGLTQEALSRVSNLSNLTSSNSNSMTSELNDTALIALLKSNNYGTTFGSFR